MPIQPPNPTVDRIERLQSISRLGEDDWLDLLQMGWSEYRRFLLGQGSLPEASCSRLRDFFDLQTCPSDLTPIDFDTLGLRFQSPTRQELPEPFLVAAYGRQRTTITSLEFLEKKYGWRLRRDILKHFRVDESSLRDAFAPVSIRLMSSICEYMVRRRFEERSFIEMGRYSFEGNRSTMIGKCLAECSSLEDLCDTYFNQLAPLFEQNCSYHFQASSALSGIVTYSSFKHVAEELGVRSVGNPQTCLLKQGMFASLPGYLNYTDAHVTHIRCEHRGDEVCQSFIDLTPCRPLDAPLD
ncbi:MAG TPA: hypothetical protein PL182_09390 [Pseudobdellovibrionaceae bacterium]|nr:hypothetical protein [Pseudobdellovibrionaceae bacterium]